MKILSLSTAEQGASLAIVDNEALVCEEYWTAKQTHSKRLVKMVEHMLEHRAQMLLEDIDIFVAAKGPGSFTGVRIGISVIKGFAYALGKPALGVSSLDGIAYQHSASAIPVCAMMDAKRNEVYCARYQFGGGRLVSKTREKVVSPFKAVTEDKEPVLFSGSGSKVYKSIIEDNAKNSVIGDGLLDFVSAASLIRALFEKEDFLYKEENILIPSYIRKSDAELQFVEK